MKINKLIKELKEVEKIYGNIEVFVSDEGVLFDIKKRTKLLFQQNDVSKTKISACIRTKRS